MFILQAVVLGVVQGLTEFLPVSSSGHLILVPRLFGWTDQGLSYDTVLHLGTLLAVLWFFRVSLVQLVKDLFSKVKDTADAARTLVIQLAVCSLPALVLGYILNDWIEQVSRKPWLVALDLALWAVVLWHVDRISKDRTEMGADPAALPRIRWSQALVVAIAQPIALLPGSSRSGITMTAGLFMGLSRSAAARFSFLLSIPVTAAAGGYGLLKWITQGTDPGSAAPVTLVVGFFAALVSGVFAIRFLLSYVSHRRFTPFVVYRLLLAIAVVVLLVR